ncbi:MAG TPA: hypothetical protein VES97_04715 [Solirubrobacteraceae bacterium]|nr:hypothetical protein [Solirubrobacteraceae bacterium]
MLLVLIPIGWLAAATLFVALCRMAARGDVTYARAAEATPRPIHSIAGRLVVWDDRSSLALRDRRSRRTAHPAARSRRATTHGLR